MQVVRPMSPPFHLLPPGVAQKYSKVRNFVERQKNEALCGWGYPDEFIPRTLFVESMDFFVERISARFGSPKTQACLSVKMIMAPSRNFTIIVYQQSGKENGFL